MALQEAIDNFKTLSSQNGELIGQNTKLLNKINELAEPMQGKQWIVDAINEMGGNASMEDSLYTLGEKIEQLVVVSPDTIFTDDVPTPINLSTIAVQPNIYKSYVKHLYSEEVLIYDKSLSKNQTIEVVNLPNAENALASSASGSAFMQCSNLKVVYLPSFVTESQSYMFEGCKNLYIAYLPMLSSMNKYYSFYGCTNLIDLTIGKNFNGSQNISNTQYRPTTAYSKTTNSLCHDDDIEKYGQTFATNWDKWKWCIINHFAANLLDRSGMEEAFTITFGSTVLAQFDEEMIAAFTDKNWTLA